MADMSHLAHGRMPVDTTSGMLVSLSKYLANPALREWLAMILLRRNIAACPGQFQHHPAPDAAAAAEHNCRPIGEFTSHAFSRGVSCGILAAVCARAANGQRVCELAGDFRS